MNRGAWAVVAMLCGFSAPDVGFAQDSPSLRARYQGLQRELASNVYQRPIHLESTDESGRLQGDIYAVVEQPFTVAGPALTGMAHWCDILILHQNVKGCRASAPGSPATLTLGIGRKFDQPLADAYVLAFRYAVLAATTDYLQLELKADKGPVGTSHYRILVEAVAIDAKRSFVHLSYAYDYGTAARIAMEGYLATIGRDKVGFSVASQSADGQPVYIRGTRGVVERNTMRYYLAIEAYLQALSVPPPAQLEQRLNDWYDGVERYPVQLHELERDEYLAMKRKEARRR